MTKSGKFSCQGAGIPRAWRFSSDLVITGMYLRWRCFPGFFRGFMSAGSPGA
jgi:hypothetical protein